VIANPGDFRNCRSAILRSFVILVAFEQKYDLAW